MSDKLEQLLDSLKIMKEQEWLIRREAEVRIGCIENVEKEVRRLKREE